MISRPGALGVAGRLARFGTLLVFATLFVFGLIGQLVPAFAAGAPPMTVPGQFGVSGAGAANYSIPIAVPPGTAGMAPSLSLVYSSQNGDGIVGFGWALSGLPVIDRCARTLAEDGAHGGVEYDFNDRFCLNGQRLVSTSGTYGADSTEYHTELDTFVRVISYGTAGNGPSYFKVWTRSGQIMEFGNTTDSRILAVGTSTARSWALDKITDVKGNYLTVTYTNDTTNGQYYPTRMDYTGNTNAGLSPYNSVQFSYNTSRPDVTPTYELGSLMQTTVLLTDIKTYQGSNLVLDYQLQYRPGSALTHSRLTSVTLCDGNSNCLAPTTFGWQGGTGTLSATSTSTSSLVGAVFGDFNGDGLTDALLPPTTTSCGSSNSIQASLTLMLGTNTGSFNQTQVTATYGGQVTPGGPTCMQGPGTPAIAGVLDFDGNGVSDILLTQSYSSFVYIYPFGYEPGYAVYALKNTGQGNLVETSMVTGGAGSNTPNLTVDGNVGAPPLPSFVTQDWNGDGLDEMLGYISNGDGTFTTNPASALPSGTTSAFAADFDGHGCTGLLTQGSSDQISNFCNSALSGINTPSWTGQIVTGDFNGDGMADVLVVPPSGSGTLFLSTGTGLSATNFAVPSSWDGCQIVAGDFDGNGRADIAVNCGGTISVYLSTGTGFVLAASLSNSAGGTATAVDLNSDGAMDLFVGATSYIFSYSPELMTSVSNGVGAATTISYDRINKNGSFYTKGTGATYPTQDMDGAYYVVSRVDASNGVGGTHSATYTYAGGKLDLRGRGFLSYSSVTTTDLQSGIVTTTNYRTDFPYAGVVSSQTKTSGSVTLSSATNTYGDSSAGTGTDGVVRHFVSLTQNVATANDLDNTAFPTTTTGYTYDSYGNILTANASVSDGSSKNTTYQYSNDTTNWILGQMTSAVVTTTVPDSGTGGTGGVQPPTAVNDSVTTNENTPVTFDPRTNDSDPSGYALTIISTGAPAHGTAVINNGTSLTYAPATNYSGSDSFTYTISDGQGHVATATVSVTVAYVAAPTGSFSASPATIAPGATSTLSWTSSGATSASIDNGVGNLTQVSSGSINASPSATTTYTLTLTGLGGTITKQITVTVVPTPTGTFSASPTSIGAGSSSTLSWTSANATSASIDNGVGSLTPVAGGSIAVTPGVTTTYTLTLTGPTGTITKQASVTVIGSPSGTFSASPTPISLGSSSTLTWSTTNTTSTSIDNGVGSVSPASGGSINVTPSVTTTYTLTMTGVGGTATRQTTVTINQPPSGTFSANPTAIAQGNASTLSWSTTNTTSASINNGVGSVATNGSVNVSPSSTTTYTLTLTGAGGTTTKQVTVTVYPQPTGSFSASPTAIALGSASTLTWSSTNATSASIDNGVGGVTTSGSVNVSPSATTTYTLTLTGAGGTIARTAAVTVYPPPTGSFSASPASITQGSSSTLSWSGSNATSASIDNGVGSVNPSGGSVNVSPSATTTYTLTLTGNGGTITRPASVTVYPPPSGSLSASPTSINPGSSSTLTWSSSNATSASINNGVGSVATSGSTNVSPSSTTTYTLTVTNALGSTATSPATVTVIQPPVAVNDTVKTHSQGAYPALEMANFDPRTNNSDPNGYPLTIIAVGKSSHGTVAIGTGGTSITYVFPMVPPYTSGVSDSFTYTISDGHGNTATATVSILPP